jgi:hypothetical protein
VEPAPAGLFAGTQGSGIFRRSEATAAPVDVARAGPPALRVAPNPFRDVARVRWELPRPAVVRVLVHDVRGRRVAELTAGMQPAGAGELLWNGTATGGRPVAPGTYFLRVEAGEAAAAAKVLRIR